MKKYLLSAAAVFLVVTSTIPSAVSGADLSAGISTWYLWLDTESSAFETTVEPGFLYGPSLSLKFNDDYSITFVMLYGMINDIENRETGTSGKFTYDMKRIDSDLALNYRLNSYFKLFAGAKYMSFKYKLDGIDFETTHTSLGPGAGISAVLPVSGNLYLLANLGGIYTRGKQESKGSGAYAPDLDFYEYGLNTNLSLAYYVEAASTTISLGGRYQYIKTVFEHTDPDEKNYFYGVTLSATYSFSF